MDAYCIRGEVDYTSQQKKIGGEYEHIGEVLREVGVSNPYDAGANIIHIYPLYTEDASCLVVVDDGTGMDTTVRTKEQLRGCNGHAQSSLASYFHIGHSTKPRGKEIGQFCMGSNLALAQADALFALVTRTTGTPSGMYWVVVKERMHAAFSDPSKQIKCTLMTSDDARRVVLDTLQEQSENYTTAWAEWIDHAFESLHADHGTLQLFVSKSTDLHQKRFLDVEQRAWPEPVKHKKRKLVTSPLHATALYTYLRFQTRHGSVLCFPTRQCEMRNRDAFHETYKRDMRRATIKVFCNVTKEGGVVPYGFPYISYAKDAPDVVAQGIAASSNIKAKTGYWSRLGPAEFTRNTATGKIPVAVFVAMDSYNVKMDEYECLDRSGTPRSGIGMSKTNGIMLTVHGVHVMTLRGDAVDKLLGALPTIEDAPGLGSVMCRTTRDGLLAWNEKHRMQNLTIIVDSLFEMKTDRNSLTPTEMHRLFTEKDFLVGLANAMQDFRDGTSSHSRTFDDMLEFMDSSKKREDESNVFANSQQRAQSSLECGSIRITPHADLHEALTASLDVVCETYALPGKGHEHSLTHLFGLYGAAARSLARTIKKNPELCPRTSRFRTVVHFWERFGLLFNGAGVDAQIFAWDVTNDGTHFGDGIECAVQHMRQCEFKIELEAHFNHPFQSCDSVGTGYVSDTLTNVTDSMGNTAEIIQPLPHDPLYGVGCYLDNIRNGVRVLKSRVDRSENLSIPVLDFSRLVRETFSSFATVTITPPRKIFKTSSITRKRK